MLTPAEALLELLEQADLEPTEDQQTASDHIQCLEMSYCTYPDGHMHPRTLIARLKMNIRLTDLK